MINKVFWKKVETETGAAINMPFRICEKCNEEFNNGNVFASKYCPKCSEQIKKEKTRERVRKYRQNRCDTINKDI